MTLTNHVITSQGSVNVPPASQATAVRTEKRIAKIGKHEGGIEMRV